jgi:hypothetical protein
VKHGKTTHAKRGTVDVFVREADGSERKAFTSHSPSKARARETAAVRELHATTRRNQTRVGKK